MKPLTIAQLAERLGVSKSTVRRIRHEVGCVVVGQKCYRFPLAAVESYEKRIWQSARSQPRECAATPSSSRSADIVFSDGSRPARRKSKRPSLKLVSNTSS